MDERLEKGRIASLVQDAGRAISAKMGYIVPVAGK
jgi:hypothetical protein